MWQFLQLNLYYERNYSPDVTGLEALFQLVVNYFTTNNAIFG